MKCLVDIVGRSEKVIDVATSLMVYQSMKGDDERSLMESVLKDDVLALDEILSEMMEFLPKEKKEAGGCSSCRGL